jgi:nicotinate-nucleotide adenylyltransferase
MRVGIFSGSFNPVHRGHIALADWFAREGVVDAVWMVRSPLNPLKAAEASLLASDADRLAMLRLAVEGHEHLSVSTIEDDMPRPSYTVLTLRRLREMWPEHEFSLIIGSDNWCRFRRWRCWDDILREFRVVVYPREGYPVTDGPTDFAEAREVVIAEAPTYEISSTDIRRSLLSSPDEAAAMLDARVRAYILQHGLYGVSQQVD